MPNTGTLCADTHVDIFFDDLPNFSLFKELIPQWRGYIFDLDFSFLQLFSNRKYPHYTIITMVSSSILGFPRIGGQRELKKTTEAYWQGKVSVDDLLAQGKQLRAHNWQLQKDAGVDVIPSNDFSFYDQVLDLSLLFNAIPERYTKFDLAPIDVLFAMGRGLQRKATETTAAVDVTALEMVKWFDSNYHYVRPTFSHSTEFKLNTAAGVKPVDEFNEAKALGIHTRPCLLYTSRCV